MPIVPFKGVLPRTGQRVFLAPDCWVTGDVDLAQDVSIFFGASLRGDILRISVGEGTNIQEGSVLHTSKGIQECIVGPRTTIGHRAIVHGCTIEGHSIIGMGATLLDSAKIGKYCIIGANSLVPLRMEIPEGHLALGVPAKVIRKLTKEEIEGIEDSAARYIEVGREYRDYFSSIDR